MRRAPDDWPDVATLIDNNFRNMHKRDVESKGREAADEESVLFLGAAFLDGNFDAVFGCGHRQCLEQSCRSTPPVSLTAFQYWQTLPYAMTFRFNRRRRCRRRLVASVSMCLLCLELNCGTM